MDMKKIFSIICFMAALLFLSNCGGGGSSSTGAANKATLSGTASDDSSASKPYDTYNNENDNYPRSNKITDWSGATIEIINSAGEVIGTTAANSDGAYTVSVDPGTNYIIFLYFLWS